VRCAIAGGHHDFEICARTIWAEARGESFEGQVAVAHVLINRVEVRHRKESTLSGVCLEPSQFSAWNLDDPNRKKLLALPWSDPGLQRAARALLSALAERPNDPTKGATYYHAKYARPRWARGETPTVVIGNHKFYAGIK